MKNELNSRLIMLIRQTLSDKINVAAYLMDLLSLGREAVYRRIRGDVSFDLEELALISKDLNISIDEVLGINDAKSLFSIDMIHPESYLNQYCDFLSYYIDIFEKMSAYPDSEVIAANNQLPFTYYLSHEKLSKFYLYKWMYQTQTSKLNVPFSEFVLPQKVIDLNKQYAAASNFACHTTSILSHDIFNSFFNTVSFFRRLGLLTQEDVDQIKEEILSLLDHLEARSISGVWHNTYEFNLYISMIDFDTSYTYMRCPEFELSMIRAFSINVVRSSMPAICSAHKKWIESLKRYSTQISKSGDIYRTEFFNRQRQLAKEIL